MSNNMQTDRQTDTHTDITII